MDTEPTSNPAFLVPTGANLCKTHSMDLKLTPAHPDFAPQWYEWRLEEEARRFNPIEDPNVDFARERLKNQAGDFANLKEGKVHRWFILERDTPVGSVAIEQVNLRMRSASVGYQIGSPYAGRGLASWALQELVRRTFEESPLERLTATVHWEHRASMRVLSKAGFEREGLLRKYLIIQGKRVDFELYSLLRE